MSKSEDSSWFLIFYADIFFGTLGIFFNGVHWLDTMDYIDMKTMGRIN